jgi:8-oxo-dGTP pyrophosphatase MutT (NUDIX family)
MYRDSYLWHLRQTVGQALMLMPGASITVEDANGSVLLVKRSDTGEWCLPGGGAEVGGSFAATAIAELYEETGLLVDENDLQPFACLSEANLHTIQYPNGDSTHYFAMCFVVHHFKGDPFINDDECTDLGFFPLRQLPEPLHSPMVAALNLYMRFKETGIFQVA